MKKQFTLEMYNMILSEADLKCITDVYIINKRKNHLHQCLVCGNEFKTTPAKLLKNCVCSCNEDHIVIDIAKPTTAETLKIETYLKNLPKKIKLKQCVTSITKPIRHKCNVCKKEFYISPCDFHDHQYQCIKC